MAPISEAQALALAAQLEREEKLHGDAGAVLLQFIASGGEHTAPCFTPSVFSTNVKILAAWCAEHLPYRDRRSIEASIVGRRSTKRRSPRVRKISVQFWEADRESPGRKPLLCVAPLRQGSSF